jgi:cellulose synthase/poly-beta-1,6-N-acetylglucosamine synthase-like glycosyltransferase
MAKSAAEDADLSLKLNNSGWGELAI